MLPLAGTVQEVSTRQGLTSQEGNPRRSSLETNTVCEIKEASWSCLKTALLCPGYGAERLPAGGEWLGMSELLSGACIRGQDRQGSSWVRGELGTPCSELPVMEGEHWQPLQPPSYDTYTCPALNSFCNRTRETVSTSSTCRGRQGSCGTHNLDSGCLVAGLHSVHAASCSSTPPAWALPQSRATHT